MTEQEFIKELNSENIEISKEQLNQLAKYYELLKNENEKVNLTRIIDKDDVYLKHYFDSITLSKVINFYDVKTIADIGSGAGFPGIVLKIMYPHLEITLIDALEKRVIFLNKVIKELKLEKIIAIHDRMENYAKQHVEAFDVITSRAVAKTNILLELGIKSLKKDGFFLLLKGEANDELQEANHAISELKCNLIEIKSFYLYQNENYRTIIKIQKKEKTPEKYPRDFAKIKKMPL